jgi:hypothetical protein
MRREKRKERREKRKEEQSYRTTASHCNCLAQRKEA